MNAVQRVRLQAISLAILLAILDQTHGFTLRYEYVRPQDLTAEESSVTEVRHELKRDIDDHDEFHVAPIALALVMTTETTATVDNEVIIMKETLSDRLETTANPNEINAAEDSMGSSSNNNEIRTFFEELVGGDNITSTLGTPEETTTVLTTFGVTDSYAIANEATSTSKGLENTISKTNNSNTNEPSNDGILTELSSTVDITTESSNFSVETTPAWKKYTNIQRKHVNVSEDTVLPLQIERVADSLNAHTTESRVSLEKAFDLAPDVLSLQELKTHLMDTTNSIPTTDLLKVAEVKDNMKTEINSTEMVSMRAGYLDHTKPLVDMITTTVNAAVPGNEIEVEGLAYETDPHEENEDIRNMTSHSQMVEDAMKEELLKEALLDDSMHYTTSKNGKVNTELNEITPSPPGWPSQFANQIAPEDLTVRPISYDKKNNLYTVNPNYKPLKKIEVQPSKPFMRDPDDNSWRNESISSLGIVFKGTNSSKAFTEVLKNKTETVMSNAPEPERVLEKVELRDRLQKIAEKRKSKKKKIDKFGNTEYTDYEENSSGDMNSSKEKSSGGSEVSLTTSAHPVTKESTTKVSFTESYRKTEKPKSALNDYYDGKDDDTDYVTLPNIDILKSTPRPRVQWPVTQKMLDNTQPMRPYLPDRQPTVQYFPPRPKTTKGNNYRDNDFNHKFTFYGHTAQPQHELIETYEYNEKTEKNPGTYRTEKYFSEDRSRAPIVDKNPPIQHVEYRPVGATDDGSFSIRHYKDLLETVIKDTDYDRNGPTPVMADEGKAVKSEEYDYGQRKEGLNRFVDYFNQNHERFKADFPVLFNTSVVHGSESGKVLASSSAMFKRLYNTPTGQKESFAFSNKPFDPNCDNITVVLSPAYELHYYVPEQEETEDHTLPYGYRT